MRIIKTLLLCTIYFFMLGNSLYGQQDLKADPGSSENQEHYKIGANDVLNIFVWKEPDLTQDVVVMPDGRIIFPMIGEIMAKGKSVIDLKATITEKLQNFVSNPEVTVMVRQSNSRIIYTIGKVTKPGPYPMASDMTVLQALSTAGGFTEWADTKFVMVVRRVNNKETMYRFNYPDFIAGKDLGQNILLEPGDTIVIP
jgi:polysaccharide biosynthesis/export protein